MPYRCPRVPPVAMVRVARLLSPAAEAAGGFASACVAVRVRGERWWPGACVAQHAPPADGVLDTAPLLVVEQAPAAAGRWLDVGVAAVWVLDGDTARLHTAGAPPTVLGPAGTLTVPGHDRLRLPVRLLRDPLRRAARPQDLPHRSSATLRQGSRAGERQYT